MSYKIVGNTVVQWEDSDPLVFTITSKVGSKDQRVSKTISFDFTGLRKGFTEEFLEALKELYIERLNRVSIVTIEHERNQVLKLFSNIATLEIFEESIAVIDEAFLLRLDAVKSKFTSGNLQFLRSIFSSNPQSPLFKKGLVASDFPVRTDKKGQHGRRVDNIITKALSRATAALILNVCDNAYAAGLMDIGHYSFTHLAFAVFVRANSYRQIRIDDLLVTNSGQYFINIVTSKTGEEYPSRVTYKIRENLGVLLTKQRQHVVETYGHLVAPEEVHKLALFPARMLVNGGYQWKTTHANENYGMLSSGGQFSKTYTTEIKRRFFNDDEKLNLNANTLRHTMGTLLAQTGASSKTIQAALKHATPDVARAYVDIAFHGMMEELSEAMRPAFEEHLPALFNFTFRSKDDPIQEGMQIRPFYANPEKDESMGECGKSIACENAPIACYACIRFIPNLDADHSISLRIAEENIEKMRSRGKPFQHLLDRAIIAKNHIFVVMNAIEMHRQTKTGAQK